LPFYHLHISEAPSEDYVGRLVHFVGEVNVDDAALEFGYSALGGLNVSTPIPRAVLVKRTCYIYQEFEDAANSTKKDMVGGGETRTTSYTLREDWTPMGPQPETLETSPVKRIAVESGTDLSQLQVRVLVTLTLR
jgi:hypothetical protein